MPTFSGIKIAFPGQSNFSGHAVGTTDVNAGVSEINSDGSGLTTPATDPYGHVWQWDGQTPELAHSAVLDIANGINTRTGQSILIIGCAVDSTPMVANGLTPLWRWDYFNPANPLDDTTLSGKMINRCKIYDVDLIVMYQGESDAYYSVTGATWKAAFLDWLWKIRLYLGKNVPCIIIPICNITWEGIPAGQSNAIRTGQAAMYDRANQIYVTVPYTVATLQDGLHLALADCAVIGNRVANLYASILEGNMSWPLFPVAGITYNNKSKNTALADAYLFGMDVKSTRLYIGAAGRIIQYALTSDISAIGEIAKTLTTEAEQRGVWLDDTETYLLTVNYATRVVTLWTLSTPGDVSTASVTSQGKVSDETLFPVDVRMAPDGKTVYVLDGTNNRLLQYTLATAYTLPGATVNLPYSGKNYSLAALGTGIGFQVSPDEKNVYVLTTNNKRVNGLVFGTIRDISTLTSGPDLVSVAENTGNVYSVGFTLDGVRMLTTGDDKVIYEYVTNAIFAPSITAQPISKAIFKNKTLTLSVTATGEGTLSYQWQKDGVEIEGATDAEYTKTDFQAGDAGTYICQVSNLADGTGGTTASNGAVITVRLDDSGSTAFHSGSFSKRPFKGKSFR